MKLLAMLFVSALLLIAGCASPKPTNLPPYDEAAYKPFAATGTATVNGGSYLVTKGGDIKKGAARQVFSNSGDCALNCTHELYRLLVPDL